jgi:hypothetical protein
MIYTSWARRSSQQGALAVIGRSAVIGPDKEFTLLWAAAEELQPL